MNDSSSRSGLWRAVGTGMLTAIPVAVAAGSLSALFLRALDLVTGIYRGHPELLWGLPLAGLAAGWLYHRWGGEAGRGNNLILEEIHEPGGGVPLRMAPLVLLGTLATHLCGGSAGREGTAVQMGGSLAGGLSRWFRAGPDTRRVMLQCGIAAGFGSVFGTPLAGAVFALEVPGGGRLRRGRALLPVLVAGVTADAVCAAWGITHTAYALPVSPEAGRFAGFDAALLVKTGLAAAGFGLAARLFSGMTHRLQHGFTRLAAWPPLRPVLGGGVLLVLALLPGARDYLGLGVETPPGGRVSILAAFAPDGADPWSWLGKSVFTAVTVGSGFKGGEVTPLFFIGATLGNTMAHWLEAPVALFAALGFTAVFAGAANTPLACALMGVELFGGHYAGYFAVACFVAWRVSGNTGIYLSQRTGKEAAARQGAGKRRD